MNETGLISNLKNAYNSNNLNSISQKLIKAFRSKQFSYLRQLYNKIPEESDHKEININKIFARLISLYHPDRLNYYLNQIDIHSKNCDEQSMKKLSHILATLEHLDSDQLESIAPDDDSYFSDIYYGYDDDDFANLSDIPFNNINSEENSESAEDDDSNNDFLTVIQATMFGNSGQDLDRFHLENLEGAVDLSGSKIDDLNGIEMCKNISRLDLSDNNITDITALGHLILLEELYLSQNDIFSVDVLSALKNLRTIDISFSSVKDISPLFELPKLEYLNLIGTQAVKKQIDILVNKGVMVII